MGDKEQLLLNILTSVLCQDEVCAMIRHQTCSTVFSPMCMYGSIKFRKHKLFRDRGPLNSRMMTYQLYGR